MGNLSTTASLQAGLGIAGGAYGLYTGLQSGGAKGAAQGVAGAASLAAATVVAALAVSTATGVLGAGRSPDADPAGGTSASWWNCTSVSEALAGRAGNNEVTGRL